jgi:hypothetical protein
VLALGHIALQMYRVHGPCSHQATGTAPAPVDTTRPTNVYAGWPG